MTYFQVTHDGTGLVATFEAYGKTDAVYAAAKEWGNQVRGQGSQWTVVKVKAPAEPRIMQTYYVCGVKRESANTAEFGYGDFPRYTPYIAFTVEADTRRSACSKARKKNPSYSFNQNSVNSNPIYTDADLPNYLREGLEVTS